ncbi:zf-HC2 domain-containing protein [Streptomyces sp. TLI_171]|uniref:zf-HC2 domain-containing protein n=1 Tax=Streptomyces sp. TLI_171 TaxID=1938859 RepID=UPI000C1783C9|nr:zf-HC2 domain-containing protein [Streptomyces sp. TLI_171]RKE20293.1 hypothetical protein BX266_3646 [Streptomyces sp. TLI_171]
MTPHPPSDHPDLDALADLAEELLPPEQAEPLHRHLAGCPACAEDYAALRGLPELLAAAPAPPLPQEVADRLTAALAAESAARAEARPDVPPADRPQVAPGAPTGPSRSGAPAGSPGAATGPGRPARRRRRGALLLLAGGAAALVAAVGGVLLSLGDRHHADVTASSAQDARATHQALSGGTPAAGGTGGPHAQPNAGAAESSGTQSGSGSGDAGGPDFTADQLPAQIDRLLGSTGAPQLGPATAAAPVVPACLTAAAGHPGEAPLAAGTGRYAGRPVVALVYRPAGDGGPLEVYLATPDCPGSTILLHSTVAAP